MGLDLRLMHVKPGSAGRVVDVKLMDERQNARVFLNQTGTEFIDLVILGGEHYHPRNVGYQISKSKRKQLLRKRRRPNRSKK